MTVLDRIDRARRWSDEERQRLTSLRCRPAGLGNRTLRVETAAIAAAAAFLARG